METIITLVFIGLGLLVCRLLLKKIEHGIKNPRVPLDDDG